MLRASTNDDRPEVEFGRKPCLKSTRLAFDERWNESAPRSRILSSPYNVKTRPTRRGAHPDDAHTRVRPHARLCRRMPPPPRLAARRAPRPRLFTACYEKNASSVPSSRLADSLAGVGQETLNQGDLLTANLALTAQALLVARAHVGVQVLLPRAPVQNLFRARIGKKKRGRREAVSGWVGAERARGTVGIGKTPASDASFGRARASSRRLANRAAIGVPVASAVCANVLSPDF